MAKRTRTSQADDTKVASTSSHRLGSGAREAHLGSPSWLAPTAITLLIVGVLYLVTYYITNATLPLPIGDWNLAVGLGIILAGGVLLTNWK